MQIKQVYLKFSSILYTRYVISLALTKVKKLKVNQYME